MNEINWIYIIDQSGATIFSYENHIQGSGNSNLALLSHFLYALKSIAKSLSEDEIRSIEMGNNRFFLCKEKVSNYLFILKSDRNSESIIITPILKQIKQKFLERFEGYFQLFIEDKIELLNAFREDVKTILSHKSNVQKFAETFD